MGGMGMGEKGIEDLYKVLELPGGGEACVGVAHIRDITTFGRVLVAETLMEDTPENGVLSARGRWACSVLEDPDVRPRYDARLANTIRLRRAIAEEKIAVLERGIAQRGTEPTRPAAHCVAAKKPSLEDLERRVAELGIEERRLRNGPPRWRRTARGSNSGACH